MGIIDNDKKSEADAPQLIDCSPDPTEGEALPHIWKPKFDLYSLEKDFWDDDAETITISDEEEELVPANLGPLYQNQQQDPEIAAMMMQQLFEWLYSISIQITIVKYSVIKFGEFSFCQDCYCKENGCQYNPSY